MGQLSDETNMAYLRGYEAGKAFGQADLEMRDKHIAKLEAALDMAGEMASERADYVNGLEPRINELEAPLRHYIEQSTFGSPYGQDGLKGAIAHHQMYAEYFERVLKGGSELETKGDASGTTEG